MMLSNTYDIVSGRDGDDRIAGAARGGVLRTVPTMGVGVGCTGRKHERET